MANKSWLLLTTVLCLLVANEFGSTAGRPQRTKSPTQTHLVRFRPITREQYDSILKLTSGKPVIPEARLINNGYRSISSISSIITEDLNSRLRSLLNITGLLGDKTSSQDKSYPLCVIRTTDLTIDDNGRATSKNSADANDDEQSDPDTDIHGWTNHPGYLMQPSYGYGSHEEDPNTDDEEQSHNSQRPIVNCIVVVKQPSTDDDTTCIHPDDPGCAEYCMSNPTDVLCCDPSTDMRCYCERNPSDRRHCTHHHSHDGRNRYAGYPPNPYGYPYGFIPYYMPGFDHRSPQLSRATPPQALIERNSGQHYGKVDRVAAAAPVKKLTATTKHSTAIKPKVHTRRVNKPAMTEMTRNVPQVAAEGYDYSQLYQHLYDAGYGRARQPQAQAQSPYGYNPYANYQFNPYAGGSFPGLPNGANLRYPAQFLHSLQPQMFPQFGNYADQNDSGEYSSGEYSGESHDDEGRAVKVQADDNKKLEHKVKNNEKKLEKN